MQKRLALFFLALILLLTLVPAYYPPDDEALRQNSPTCDVYNQSFAATCATCDLNHSRTWTGLLLFFNISYLLPQYVPTSTETRAPPAA